MIINVSIEGICCKFEEKTTKQHWFSYFQIAVKYWKIFFGWPVKYNFWLFWYM